MQVVENLLFRHGLKKMPFGGLALKSLILILQKDLNIWWKKASLKFRQKPNPKAI